MQYLQPLQEGVIHRYSKSLCSQAKAIVANWVTREQIAGSRNKNKKV